MLLCVPVLRLQIIQLDDDKGEIVQRGVFDHPYPATRIMWAPEAASREKDLLATAGDYLRLWQVYPDGDSKMECLLNNVRRCARSRDHDCMLHYA